MNRAIFIDRDGVINRTIFRLGKERAPYSLEEFELLPQVLEAVVSLRELGFLTIVVTNQPDVSRGWVDRAVVDAVNRRTMELLPLDDLKACFHDNQDGCECRKPKPGMLLTASEEHAIDLKSSYMVGDRISDVEAGRKAGCRTILIGSLSAEEGPVPDHQAISLWEAYLWIKKREGGE
jgi:D-glycero-D-manno-heptose 1,7-bisphosphate phosphatase